MRILLPTVSGSEAEITPGRSLRCAGVTDSDFDDLTAHNPPPLPSGRRVSAIGCPILYTRQRQGARRAGSVCATARIARVLDVYSGSSNRGKVFLGGR